MEKNMNIRSFHALINRRTAITTMLSILLLRAELTYSQSASLDSIEVQIIIPVVLLRTLQEDRSYSQLAVKGDATTVDPTRGLPLIYVAAGLMLLPELARSLVALYRDYKYGGTLIEVRNGKFYITQDDRLDADTIIVKDAAGRVSVHRSRNSANMEKWVELLTMAKK